MATLAAHFWAWPPGTDGDEKCSVFACPRLWFAKVDLDEFRLQTDDGCMPADDDYVKVTVNGDRIECRNRSHRAIWILTGDEDVENQAVLGVWPD